MESCPASVLKRLELYTEPYKGNTAKHGQRRRVILDHLKMPACTIRSCSLDYIDVFGDFGTMLSKNLFCIDWIQVGSTHSARMDIHLSLRIYIYIIIYIYIL